MSIVLPDINTELFNYFSQQLDSYYNDKRNIYISTQLTTLLSYSVYQTYKLIKVYYGRDEFANIIFSKNNAIATLVLISPSLYIGIVSLFTALYRTGEKYGLKEIIIFIKDNSNKIAIKVNENFLLALHNLKKELDNYKNQIYENIFYSTLFVGIVYLLSKHDI